MSAPPSNPLNPPLPYDMAPSARRALRDIPLQQYVGDATRKKNAGRVDACTKAFGERYDDVRAAAGRIKQHTLDHLDHYLEQFIGNAETAGARVHYAADAAEARDIAGRIARGRALCVKSKSMVTEEIDLASALAEAGIEMLETDLGEFIVQLDGDVPAHIVTPIIHKNRAGVARTFQHTLGVDYTEDPGELTAIARRHMRERYRRADLGVSGANFLVAESGSVVMCTNEGNGDLAVSVPPVHIVFAGIEKVIPRLDHLTVFLKLLARSATAQDLTVYTSLITGSRRPHEIDGPDEVHIVLVDNGRSGLLRPESRELLRCIRCGACLNACPVFRKVGGGHAYGAVYSGPIGAVITPLMKGVANYRDLPQASSLCGACGAACPVHIDLPAQLVRLRRLQFEGRMTGLRGRLALRLWAKCLKRPWLYRLFAALQRSLLRLFAGDRRVSRWWCRRLPGTLSGWTAARDFPAPARRGFRDWWRDHERER